MKASCGRDREQQLPAADLADSMELALSRLCFFLLQFSANTNATGVERPAKQHERTAETLGFPEIPRSSLADAGEQLLFQENRLEVARAVNNFARFALN